MILHMHYDNDDNKDNDNNKDKDELNDKGHLSEFCNKRSFNVVDGSYVQLFVKKTKNTGI